MKAGPRRCIVITWGCPDERVRQWAMADVLGATRLCVGAGAGRRRHGHLNTCHIRDKAAEKVFSELGRLRRLKEQRAARAGG